MTRPARFWPLATLILLPVLVLAVVAAYGLSQRRQSLRAEAAQQCEARPLLEEWVRSLDEAALASAPVVLYDDPPVPSADAEPDKFPALAEMDEPALLSEMRGAGRSRMVASGLPRRVLAAWEWMQRVSAPDRSGPSSEEVDAFMRKVLEVEPSAISPVILEKMALRFPAKAGEWRRAWERMEVKRAALRFASPTRWQVGRVATPETLVLPVDPSDRPELLEALKSKHLGFAQSEYPGTLAMIFIRGSGLDRVLLEEEWRPFFGTLLDRTHRMLPAWAAVSVRIHPSLFAQSGIAPAHGGVAQIGEPLPEVLGRAESEFISLEIGPREAGWLLRDFYRLVWWVSGLIGGALATALLGLWLVRRTLNKERRLGDLKSQFVSSVSHELRAPVGSLRLMAEGLASGKVSGPAADEYHRLMAGEGARLSSLIENVLDFARIEQGRKHYQMAETDVAALVQDAVKLMSPQAEAKGLRIVCALEPLPCVPKVDAGALQQAVINLLDNAIKFTPVAGTSCPRSTSEDARGQDVPATISVRLAADPSRPAWSLAVTDEGIGIPEEEHSRIFDRFYRLGNELRRETTGTGIGLAIVKHIVEGHGGRVEVESEMGKGSTFRMELPGGVISNQLSVFTSERALPSDY